MQPCRQMQRNGARNRTKRTGISLGHASNPGAPLGRRAFRPRRQDGGWERTQSHGVLHPIPIGNKKHTHGWDWDASIFHQKTPSDPWRFVRCYARGQRERQNVLLVAFRLDKTRRKIAGRPRRFRISAWEPNGTHGRTGRVRSGLNGESSCGCAGRTAEYSGGGLRWDPGRAGDTAKMFGTDIAGIFAPAVAAV